MAKQEPSEFGRWLILARGEAGLTQDALSERCGLDDDGKPLIHVNTIKNIEAGKTQKPSARTAAILKAALGETPVPEDAREAMDRHTQSFLDLVGAYLMTLPPKERLTRVFKLTREILGGGED